MITTPIFDEMQTDMMKSAEFIALFIRGRIEMAYDDEDDSILIGEIYADFMYSDHSDDANDFGFNADRIYADAKCIFADYSQAMIDLMMMDLIMMDKDI